MMRRPASNLPITPKMLKHFAAASIVLTIVLATFAGGGDAGVAAQVEARQAKNDLLKAEQEKLGTRKIASHLKVRGELYGFDDEQGGTDYGGRSGDAGGGGGGGSAPAARSASPWQATPPGVKSVKPRVAPDRRGLPDLPEGGPAGSEGNGGPSASDTASLIEASRARSGNSGSSGD